jgi:hypothetical protein
MMITNYPGMKVKPGSMGKPFPGIEAAVLDLKTNEPITEPGKVGLIAFKPGWPSACSASYRKRRLRQQVPAPPRTPPPSIAAPDRLVPVRRPGQHRPGRLLLVRRAATTT